MGFTTSNNVMTASSSFASLASIEVLGTSMPPVVSVLSSPVLLNPPADTSSTTSLQSSMIPVTTSALPWEKVHVPCCLEDRSLMCSNSGQELAFDVTQNSFGLFNQLHVSGVELPPSRPSIVGHRGALYDELENTRPGFLRCVEKGCDAVELDVFLLKDGEVVVFHGGGSDENPGDLSDYCMNQKGTNILDLTYDESLQLQFNPGFQEFGCDSSKIVGATIPTLRQVLTDLKPTTCNVKIELKSDGTPERCLQIVEELDMLDQIQFSSFDHQRLKQLRQLRPDRDKQGRHLVRTGALFKEVPVDFIEQALNCGADEIHLRYDTCTRERVQMIHGKGLGSMAWVRGPRGMTADASTRFFDVGNEDDDCYRALIATGVQQLCCNHPVEALLLVKDIYQEAYS